VARGAAALGIEERFEPGFGVGGRVGPGDALLPRGLAHGDDQRRARAAERLGEEGDDGGVGLAVDRRGLEAEHEAIAALGVGGEAVYLVGLGVGDDLEVEADGGSTALPGSWMVAGGGTMIEHYGRLAAWVYDLDKPVGRSFGDVEHYRDRLAGVDGPVLEPAVGNGRLLVPLLEAGVRVMGFDASAEMLAFCRHNLSARGLEAPVWQARFEDFLVPAPVAAIVLPAGSFELVTDLDLARTVLRRFHDTLAPGGRLILDIDPVADVLAEFGPERQWRTANGDVLHLGAERLAVDRDAQTTTTALLYRHERAGRVVASERQLFVLRWWTVAELTTALAAAGFTGVVASGGYRFGSAPAAGEVVTLEASRA
jgi:SAM-dependent methyltransferase